MQSTVPRKTALAQMPTGPALKRRAAVASEVGSLFGDAEAGGTAPRAKQSRIAARKQHEMNVAAFSASQTRMFDAEGQATDIALGREALALESPEDVADFMQTLAAGDGASFTSLALEAAAVNAVAPDQAGDIEAVVQAMVRAPDAMPAQILAAVQVAQSAAPAKKAPKAAKAVKQAPVAKTGPLTQEEELAALIASQSADAGGDDSDLADFSDAEAAEMEAEDNPALDAAEPSEEPDRLLGEAGAMGASAGNYALVQYLNSLRRFPLLTRERETELALLKEAGGAAGEKAADEIYHANLRLVVHVAKKFVSRASSFTILDIIQEGNIGLLAAVRDFDTSKQTRFSTYATYWITQGIQRGLAYRDPMIRLTEREKEIRSLVRKCIEAAGDATSLSLSALPDFVSKNVRKDLKLKVDTVSVVDLRRWSENRTSRRASDQQTALVDIHGTIGGDDEGRTLADVLAGDNPDLEAQISARQVLMMVEQALDTLNVRPDMRDREVFCMRNSINDEQYQYTLEEVASRFGFTRERARQIEKRATEKFFAEFREIAGNDADIEELLGFKPSEMPADVPAPVRVRPSAKA